MSDASDNKILIKFEIHVPVGAGQTPVVVQPEALRQADLIRLVLLAGAVARDA